MNNILKNPFPLIVFLISAAIFVFLTNTENVISDILPHANSCLKIQEEITLIPGNFLYFLTVLLLKNTFNFFPISEIGKILGASILVLASSVTLKYIICQKILQENIADKINISIIRLTAFLLLFVFSFPVTYFFYGRFYIGLFPPNVWHNDSVIFLMPFALMLFWLSYKQLETPNNKKLWVIFLLVIINIFAKPSFFFCFAVIYPLFLLNKYRVSSIFWYNILPVAIGVILFIAQYLYIYNINPVDSKDGIAVAPFLFLSNWINLKLLPFTVLASITFPLVLFISYFNTLKKELIVKYAVALFTVALLIGFTFIETGHRRWDGNFMWQAIVCSFILYLVACKQLLKIYLTKGVDLRIKFNTVVFLLHFIIGIVYLAFYFKTGVYL